jgi:hypothetical protein
MNSVTVDECAWRAHVWIIIIALLLLGARTILVHVPGPATRTMAIIAYLWVIWQVLTRI